MKEYHQFLCRNCEREISAPPAAVGQKTRCHLCEGVIVVPTADQDRQFRAEVQRRNEAARLQKETGDAEKRAQRGQEEAAERERKFTATIEEERKKREENEALRRQREEENEARRLKVAAFRRKQATDPAVTEQELIRSGMSVSSVLWFCAVLCWIGALILVIVAVSVGAQGGVAAVLPCVIPAAACVLSGILLAVFAGWIENYSWVIARISETLHRQENQGSEK